jgi:hypothetical protein
MSAKCHKPTHAVQQTFSSESYLESVNPNCHYKVSDLVQLHAIDSIYPKIEIFDFIFGASGIRYRGEAQTDRCRTETMR